MLPRASADSVAVPDPAKDGLGSYLQGNVLLMDGRFREAIVWFRRSAAFDTTEAGPPNGIARCYTELEQPDSALMWTQIALRHDPEEPLLHRLAGINLSRLGRGEQAVAAFRRALDLAPEDLSTRMNLLSLYDAMRQPEAAMELIDGSPEEIRQLSSLRARRARLLLQTDRTAEAIPDLLEVLRQERDFPDAEALLLLSLAKVRMSDTLLAGVERLLAEQPGLDRVRIGLARILLAGELWPRVDPHLQILERNRPRDPSVQKLLGMYQLRSDRPEQAADRFREAERLAPDDPEPLRWLCRIASMRGEPGEALKIASRIEARSPGDRDGRMCQAFALSDLKRTDEAIGVLEMMLERDRGDREAALLQALLLVGSSRFDRAEATLRGVLRETPGDGEIAFRLGTVLEQAGEVDSALAVFDRLLASDPDNALVLNYAGYLCIDRGLRLAEAVARVQRAVELDPENGAYLDSYGWGLHRMDRSGEAVGVLERAVARAPGEAVIHLHLGQVLEALGRYDEARKAYRRAADLDPKDEEARRLLRSLKEARPGQPGR